MVELLPKYENYELIVVREGEHDEYAGMRVLADADLIPVLPLNGWRGRNLADSLFGRRDAGLLTLGTAKLVRADVLKDLPQWDEVNERYLSPFKGIVAIEVVAVEQGYGRYITVTQMSPATVVEYVFRQRHLHDELSNNETGRLGERV